MKLLFLLILSLPLWGQQIVTFTPAQKAAIVGPLNCTFYAQHPNPGQVQIYCTNAGTVIHNEIQNLTNGTIENGTVGVLSVGIITWVLSPNTLANAAPNSILYQICVNVNPPGGPTEVIEDGIF